MSQAEARKAQFKSSLPPPSDEELTMITELKAKQARLQKTRDLYTSLIDCLHNEFKEAWKEEFNPCRINDILRAELVKIAHKFSFQNPEGDGWKQPTST